MEKFLNGKRDFVKDQIIFFIEQEGLDYKLRFGKVDGYCGRDIFYIKIYAYSLQKGTNDVIFLDRFPDVDLRNVGEIENAINEGTITEGVFSYFDRRRYLKLGTKVYKKDIFKDYDSGKSEAIRRTENGRTSRKALSEMSDYDYTLWEVEQTIKYLTEKSKDMVKSLILTTDVTNIFSVKIANGEFKYRYSDGEYINLCEVEYEKTEYEEKKKTENQRTEQYLVSVSKYYDFDHTLFIREFTNDNPEAIFEKYGKNIDNRLEIVNRNWGLEDGVKTPIGYGVGYNTNGDRILVTKYKFTNGTFDIREGKIGDFDIYLNRLHKISNMGLRSFSKVKSKIFQSQIDRALKNKLTNMMGKEFSQMIIDRLELE